MIPLQVPDGEFCAGCMFLEINHFKREASCRLFDEVLSCLYEYCSIDTNTIRKCERCPRNDSYNP